MLVLDATQQREVGIVVSLMLILTNNWKPGGKEKWGKAQAQQERTNEIGIGYNITSAREGNKLCVEVTRYETTAKGRARDHRKKSGKN